jgi:peptide chain release factor 2
MQMLRSQLYEIELKKQQAERANTASKMNGELTIGNYVMQPYKLVKDVRSGYENRDVDGVMNGDIDNPESLSNDDGAKRRGVV